MCLRIVNSLSFFGSIRIDLVKRIFVKAGNAVDGVSFRVQIQLQDLPLVVVVYVNPHVPVGNPGIRIVAGSP